MMFGHYGLAPLRIKGKLYALDINGEVDDPLVLKNIFAGNQIDVSNSFDPITKKSLIIDI